MYQDDAVDGHGRACSDEGDALPGQVPPCDLTGQQRIVRAEDVGHGHLMQHWYPAPQLAQMSGTSRLGTPGRWAGTSSGNQRTRAPWAMLSAHA